MRTVLRNLAPDTHRRNVLHFYKNDILTYVSTIPSLLKSRDGKQRVSLILSLRWPSYRRTVTLLRSAVIIGRERKGLTMKKTTLIATLVLFAFCSFELPSVAFAGGVLDGKRFETLLDGDNDILKFDEGTFHSSSCEEWGFGPGDYTTKSSGDGISFEATTTSEKHGTMVWTGTVVGDNIKGSYHWTKEGWFGTKSKKKNFEGSIIK